MRTVTLYDSTTLPVIGLGTWNMGGGMRPDPGQDATALQALRLALDLGYTHIDTAEMYANGHTEELVGQALRPVTRQNVFVTTKVRPHNLRYKDVLKSLDGSLYRLGLDYVDLFLIHWPSGSIPLAESFRALNQTVRDGKVRFLGVSNFSVKELKQAQALSETPVITNQVPYSVSTRTYVRNGVIPYCQANGIVVTAYSPVEEGHLKSNARIESIAAAHDATPYQIALAWLVQQPGVITIPMSQNPEHLRQNLQAVDIQLSQDEMEALTG